MYLAEIQLENIRCFDELHLDFLDDNGKPIMWTVIFGENGTGKTTLLRMIALLISDKFTIMEFTDNQPRNMLRYNTKRGLGRIKLKTGQVSKKKIDSFKRGWHFIDAPRDRGLMKIAGLDRNDFHDYMIFLCVYGETRTPSHRPYRGFSLETTDPSIEHLSSLFNEGTPMRAIDAWLKELHYQDLVKGKSKDSRFKLAIKALEKILPSAPKFEKMAKGQAFFKTPYGIVPISQLSSGFRDVACLLMDITSRLFDAYPSSKNPLNENGIVIIDELSLHLHPKWQKVIVGQLRKYLPNIQFITTTHSPLIAQSLEELELVTLQRVKPRGREATVKIKRLEFSPKGYSADQLLTSPIFGLASAKSVEVEKKGKRLTTLRNKIARRTASKKEETEYERIVEELERLGEAPGDTDKERAFYVVVEKLLSEMGDTDLVERPSLKQLKKMSEKK